MNQLRVPQATYRIQFTPEFGFSDALRILPYLKKLGITDIYASPINRPCAGSMHGYNVCDPRIVNPELGTLEEFEALLGKVAKNGMGWVQDIVPNHMAFSHENPFLVDVLEHGVASQYADFFDITWDHQHESLNGKLLVPFLGKPYGNCVTDGELKLIYENGDLWVAYYDNRYPLCPESYWTVLGDGIEELQNSFEPESDEYTSFCGALHTLKNLSDVMAPQERFSLCAMAKSVLRQLVQQNVTITQHLQQRIKAFATGTPESNIRFDELMAEQNFRLAYWKVASEELNYRRFFTVSDLICIRVEYEHVFEKTHAFILDLVDRNLVTGLRIDHIDGLFDPEEYLRRLRLRAPKAYIVVEKILDKSEKLPPSWHVQGTTGYDLLNHLSYLFCDTKSEKRFDKLYARIVGAVVDPEELQIAKKRLIIGKHMAGDIDNLAQLIMRITGIDLMGRDITLYGLRRALVEVLTHFSVYRTYISTESISREDVRYITQTLKQSRAVMAGLSVEFDFIERFLMMKGEETRHAEFDDAWKSAVMRFQQFTGPLMAKGFEDTLFYVYNRHCALNEVGGWPEVFGINPKEFHAFISKRNSSYPLSMNATDSHDTKRGEDTRARMQVLSEIPVEWTKQVTLWKKLNAAFAVKKRKVRYPDLNDEYLLYQTLVGSLPFGGVIDEKYVTRIKEYMIKAVKEAKVYTAWIKPDEEYESAVVSFVENCLDQSKNSEFIDNLKSFAATVSWFGVLNSLSQVTLKMTLPGIPDIYQGTEGWNLSLVDPDNRRPVDYDLRTTQLEEILKPDIDASELYLSHEDGRIKMFVVNRCLAARVNNADLFERGSYEPLRAIGDHAQNVVAFSRKTSAGKIVVIVPRLTTKIVEPKVVPMGNEIWRNTRIRLPSHLRDLSVNNIFTGECIQLTSEVMVGDLLKKFGLGVFIA